MSQQANIADYAIDSGDDNPKGGSKADNQDEEIEEAVYVEKILDKKMGDDGTVYYKVRWQGHDDDEATWEPEENLFNLEEMINEFDKKYKKKNRAPSSSDEEEIRGQKQSKKQKTGHNQSKITDFNKKEKTSVGKNLPVTGSLRYKDKPKEILAIRTMSEPGIFLFRVKWERRRSGEVPGDSYVSSEDFMKYDPRFLLEFYHSKIKFKNLEKALEKKLGSKSPSKNWDQSLDGNLGEKKAGKSPLGKSPIGKSPSGTELGKGNVKHVDFKA
eukprot:CAMPEP_0176410666 /NCGR_PEP_ID=MMETSP0127-20121128/3180_1 /TAXON_ID=938130 /ORGANISM="Platyophrya macrostoma, Strain WH" /LENGTH=270 /DNA_ID=CAMNT_0017790181 /DNA_START=35 /DNA_END=847 /DNA_ORIENTATION=-